MRTIHSLSGPYGMSANTKGHYLRPDGRVTLCGRDTTKTGGRWTRQWSSERPLSLKYDCLWCIAAEASQRAEG